MPPSITLVTAKQTTTKTMQYKFLLLFDCFSLHPSHECFLPSVKGKTLGVHNVSTFTIFYHSAVFMDYLLSTLSDVRPRTAS